MTRSTCVRTSIGYVVRGCFPAQAMLLLQVGDSEQPAVFISAGDQPIPAPRERAPSPRSPFSGAFDAMARLLEDYGGIWVTFPDEEGMKGLLETARASVSSSTGRNDGRSPSTRKSASKTCRRTDARGPRGERRDEDARTATAAPWPAWSR